MHRCCSLLIFSGFAACDEAESPSASITKKDFSLPCRLGKRDVQKPLRAHVFYRDPFRFENMVGFVDNYSQEDPKGPVDKAFPIQQRYLIQLDQKVEKINVMQMRLDIYARQNCEFQHDFCKNRKLKRGTKILSNNSCNSVNT